MRAREIKFRAWSKHDKKMIEWDEMLKANNPAAWFTGHLKTVILMQATGIKDINGKEIYEGDILKTTFMKSMGESGKDVSCVIWNEFVGAWMISYTGGFGGAASDYIDKYKHEIIGNIAENRELLPVQNLEK
jgi:uncharacterized phage protein (TIGR01671 family)